MEGHCGTGIYKDGFATYVENLTFTLWRPSFVVLHNTALPTFAEWHDVIRRPTHGQSAELLAGYAALVCRAAPCSLPTT
jgi:hypothetical protein